MESDLGGFAVEVYTDYSSVDGQVADAVVPMTVLEEMQVEGTCRLLRRNNPHCDPLCDPDETCDFDGTCLPYPEDQDLGQVTVSGLVVPVTMDPRAPGARYFDTTLPHPGFEPDVLVTLRTGGVFGDQSLYGVGVEALEPGETSWILEPEKDLVVTWTPASGLVRGEVSLRIDIDQHGTSPASVHCTFPDTGQGVVGASMVNALVESGVSGFPTGSLVRQTIDRVLVDEGCFDFSVASPRRTDEVRVLGYTPCDEHGDCPPGQRCDLDIELCVDIE